VIFFVLCAVVKVKKLFRSMSLPQDVMISATSGCSSLNPADATVRRQLKCIRKFKSFLKSSAPSCGVPRWLRAIDSDIIILYIVRGHYTSQTV